MNRRSSVSGALISVVLTLSFSFAAAAQQITGSIRGTVTDPAGATVPGASVSAMQLETGLMRTAVTDITVSRLLRKDFKPISGKESFWMSMKRQLFLFT